VPCTADALHPLTSCSLWCCCPERKKVCRYTHTKRRLEATQAPKGYIKKSATVGRKEKSIRIRCGHSRLTPRRKSGQRPTPVMLLSPVDLSSPLLLRAAATAAAAAAALSPPAWQHSCCCTVRRATTCAGVALLLLPPLLLLLPSVHLWPRVLTWPHAQPANGGTVRYKSGTGSQQATCAVCSGQTAPM